MLRRRKPKIVLAGIRNRDKQLRPEMRFLYKVLRLHKGLRESAVSMVSSRLVDRYALFCDFDGSPVGSPVMSGYRIA